MAGQVEQLRPPPQSRRRCAPFPRHDAAGPIASIACFCGARDGARPVFRDSAQVLGRAMAERGLSLVYGGGALGMMGAIADAVLAAGGKATGVIPHGLARAEFAHARLTALHRVETMH